MSSTPSTILSNIFGLLDGKDAIVDRSVSKQFHARSELHKRDQPLILTNNATITPNALRSLSKARRDASSNQPADKEKKDQLHVDASDDEEKAQLVLPTSAAIDQMKADELRIWIGMRSKASSRPDPTTRRRRLFSTTGPVSVLQCTQLTPESSLSDILALSGSSSIRYAPPMTDAGRSLLPLNWGSTFPLVPELRSLDLTGGVRLQDQDLKAILT